MKRLEFPVEYSFDVETNSVVATVPDLNYISSFGKDFAEAEQNVSEAILTYLEALKMDGLPIPS
ncbi:type II toxin-antitoxin system HicB family antitoxin [Crocosphaera sp. XPORK-15E]|uniref:type II toxin-antitoxin system HicB family antitoxin n=1 Tax=Crocosphaera sp. XPORK-15E TaxID=3110247 RepID=UPI002B20DC92|nr:type II toxin-antitoxin system HicB family antitoxin [Crocosphaera sp. XPORK-15E]MEA5534907.1 type II toxin-antitoxin system HicB family antitoxin [Crocosphaera sp. XPORK-15E]